MIRDYTIADYKASEQNWAVEMSDDGILYVANNTGLLTFDGNTWAAYHLPDESILNDIVLSHDTIFTRSETSIGYWLPDGVGFLAYYPLGRIPPHIHFRNLPEKAPFPVSEEIARHKPSAFVRMEMYNIVGTYANGIYVAGKKGNPLLNLNTQLGLQDNIVNDICMADNGDVWVAFDNGLSKIIFNPPLRLLAARSLIGKVSDVALHDSVLYIKTNTNYYMRKLVPGVVAIPVPEELAAPLFRNNRGKGGLSIKDIVGGNPENRQILESDYAYRVSDSLYWFTKENEAALVSLVKNGRYRLKCRILFDNYNFNLVYRENQIFPLNDSLHIASTMQGVVLINSNRVARSLQGRGFPLQFMRIRYRDAKGFHYLSPGTKAVVLPHDFISMTVHAASSAYHLNNQISYRIEGLPGDWSEWQHDGMIRLLRLPEGSYSLRVRRYSPIGAYPTISLPFKVLVPWYKTVWAFIAYALLLYLAIQVSISLYKLRKRRKAALARQKEMLETELQNKKNELMKQTSSVIEKGLAMNKLMDELDRQKELSGASFPDRSYQRLRSLMQENLNNQKDWNAFETYFDSAHQSFIKRFREKYSDITSADIRLCCLLRMNLSTKEIASILNISIRAIELRRYRLRKRIGLDGDTNLVEFLMNF